MAGTSPNWWKTAICYQVWPASYKDGNGDGLGDIPGLIGTLDYLASLGIDTLWLSPMYDSPQVDMGYDISNYEAVYPPYGTMDDIDQLIKGCQQRNIKLVLDLVINHTSDLHEWFKESRESKTGKYADWYIWKDPKIVDGEKRPPTNWKAAFGGSVWEYVKERDQYYLHIFTKEQPDLNWENEEARRGIYESAIEFWLKKGVSGFRVDVANLYSKDTSYPDAPITEPGDDYQPGWQYFVNGPRMHEFSQEIRREVLDRYGDVVMIGEAGGCDMTETLKYVSAETREFSMLFDMVVVSLGGRFGAEEIHQVYQHTLPEFKEAWRKAQDVIRGTDGWISVFLENHDQPRSVSRYTTDSDEYRERATKLLSILLCTLSGTLFLYQGQEIGMTNYPEHWPIEELKDIASLNVYNEIAALHNNHPLWLSRTLKGLQKYSRDNARTPVQWDASPNAGFSPSTSTAKPWMRVHDNYRTLNVAAQEQDQNSPLHFWRKMIQFRKQYADLAVFGEFDIWDKRDKETFTFTKTDKAGNRLVVALNFTGEEQPLFWPKGWDAKRVELVLTNVDEAGENLQPWEGRVYHVPA